MVIIVAVIIIIIQLLLFLLVFLGATAAKSNYVKLFPNVFVGACGTGFYEQCFPSQTIDFGFSSTTIHWLSRKPCDLEDSVYFGGSSRNDDVRAFKEQDVADWKLFLLQRAAELKPGNTGLIKRVLQV